jgi:hypothetical protein
MNNQQLLEMAQQRLRSAQTGGWARDAEMWKAIVDAATAAAGVEARKARAYRAMRVFEPSMEGYNAAVAVYEAAFGDTPDTKMKIALDWLDETIKDADEHHHDARAAALRIVRKAFV